MLDDVVKGLVSGREKPDGRVVEAEHFILRDPAKNVRALLTNLFTGRALALFDLNEEIRTVSGCDDSGEAVYLKLDCPDLIKGGGDRKTPADSTYTGLQVDRRERPVGSRVDLRSPQEA